jgi:ATP-dependent Lon protease
VGPPGVGKTSLAKSVARATNRKFVRLSLGGVRDEAEIRGHRRTYIGAFPGQIIQMMKKAGTVNPLILLDEVDKMSMDFRGDPASALLEVLDPEQNHSFQDHYLDVEYDLSNVMFIATANVLQNMPQALMDRLEVIRLPGYTEEEKLEIAKRFLVEKQKEANGLKKKNVSFDDEALIEIIRRYTREAGVRSLEREIASVCRKVARNIVKASKKAPDEAIHIDRESIAGFLGVPKYRPRSKEGEAEVGMATGLAWTEVGGDLLTTEATLMPGKGELTLTGKLGEVMQESARTALSVIRSRAERYGLSKDFHKKIDIHLHVPEGAIPKDGPSAGITLATALLSALSDVPVHSDVAMTGEITLRGKVLPIGGVKEKLLAAHRAGIIKIVLPVDNEKDLSDIPEEIRKQLSIKLVDKVEDVFETALTAPPRALADELDEDTELEPDLPPDDEGPVAGESIAH